MESGRRTLVKAVLWTVLGCVVMTLVGLAFTGSAAVGGAMAVINACLGFVTYLVYERIWSRIPWGRL